MGVKRSLMKSVAGFAVLSMTLGSTANAAVTNFETVDPLVAVSLLGSAQSQAAVCAPATTAAATAAAAGQAGAAPGCVLPASDAAPPPPVTEVAPPPPPVGSGGGIGVLPILVGLAAIAAIAVLVLKNDNDDGRIVLPISP